MIDIWITNSPYPGYIGTMVRQIIILFSFVACLSLLSLDQARAQSADYLPGYVVLSSGDTIRGLVMDRREGSFPELLNKIRIKPKNGRKRKYRPKDIVAYGRREDHFISIWIHTEMIRLVNRYYSIPAKGEQTFVKVVRRGRLNYYHWEYEDGEFNSIEFVPLFKQENRPEMVRVTQGILGLKKKRLSEYFMDCPKLVFAIQNSEVTSAEEILTFHGSCR